MITLTANLLAAQKASPRRPYLEVTARARRAGALVFPWTRWYTGAEPDEPIAACVAGDGSLVRARNNAGNVRTSRVAPPVTSGSTFSTWTSLTASGTTGTGLALCARAGEVLIAYVKTNAANREIVVRSSADNGATWGAETIVISNATVKEDVAVAIRQSNGDACLFWRQGAQVVRARRTSGAWGAATNWTLTNPAGLTGLAAGHNGADYVLLLSGTELTTTHKRVWVTVFGDGGIPSNTWAALVNVDESDTASTMTFEVGGNGVLHDLTAVYGNWARKESGAVASNRTFEAHPPPTGANNATWSEPSPTGVTGLASGAAYAAAPNTTITRAYLVTPFGVWAADTGQVTDLSARVLKATYDLGPEHSRCLVTLDNADAALSGSAGQALGLFTGGTIELKPGYVTAGGSAEFGVVLRFQVVNLVDAWSQGKRIVIVKGVGAWEAAELYAFPQAWQTAAALVSRGGLIARFAARMGWNATNGTGSEAPSANLTGHQPSFLAPAGESVASAMRRLLEPLPDGVRAEGDAFVIVGISTADAVDYTYGTDHPIEQGAVFDSMPTHNWTVLHNPNVRYSQAVEEPSIYRHGPLRDFVRSLDASSNTRADDYARDHTRRATWARKLGELDAGVNAGLQLFDVVAVTLPQLGLAAVNYRVVGIKLDFDRGRGPTYRHTITLGGL
ncbi:MAG: hypothetical protein ACKVVT_10100 [Dehalococcoidia bacterium]